MSDTFDAEKFLSWLDERDGPIAEPSLVNEWPNFPWDYTTGVTGCFVDGDGEVLHDLEEYDGEAYFGYYKRDLRRAARKKMPVD